MQRNARSPASLVLKVLGQAFLEQAYRCASMLNFDVEATVFVSVLILCLLASDAVQNFTRGSRDCC